MGAMRVDSHLDIPAAWSRNGPRSVQGVAVGALTECSFRPVSIYLLGTRGRRSGSMFGAATSLNPSALANSCFEVRWDNARFLPRCHERTSLLVAISVDCASQ